MEEEMKLEDEMEQDKIIDKFKSTIRISARVRKELKQNKQNLNQALTEEKQYVQTVIEKKKKCLCFISNHKAIYLITYFDLFTVFLGITIAKGVGACLTRANYERIHTYKNLRQCTLAFELIFIVGICIFFGVKIISEKHYSRQKLV